MHVALVICVVCGQVDCIEYKTKKPTKCRTHTNTRPDKQPLGAATTPCGVCATPVARHGHGKGQSRYCVEHTPATMDAYELRALYKQYPNGAVWQIPKYRRPIEHLIRKSPRH